MWKHKKYKSRIYVGSYRFPKWGREFILTSLVKGNEHNISFESWQAAQIAGWIKIR